MRRKNNTTGTNIPLAQQERVSEMKTSLFELSTSLIILDDNLEVGYLRAYSCHSPIALQRICGQTHSSPGAELILDVVVRNHGSELYLHQIDILLEYDFVWPNLLRYLEEYAAKQGCVRVFATGKSTNQPRETVIRHLTSAGYREETPFRFVRPLRDDQG